MENQYPIEIELFFVSALVRERVNYFVRSIKKSECRSFCTFEWEDKRVLLWSASLRKSSMLNEVAKFSDSMRFPISARISFICCKLSILTFQFSYIFRYVSTLLYISCLFIVELLFDWPPWHAGWISPPEKFYFILLSHSFKFLFWCLIGVYEDIKFVWQNLK